MDWQKIIMPWAEKKGRRTLDSSMSKLLEKKERENHNNGGVRTRYATVSRYSTGRGSLHTFMHFFARKKKRGGGKGN